MPSGRSVPPGRAPLTRRQPKAGVLARSWWYNSALMRGIRGFALGVSAGACALAMAACGGGERQDANEPSGSFRLEVVSASFPTRQSLADRIQLKIRVKNADTEAVPNVSVTVETEAGSGGAAQAFATDIQRTDVADRSRPIWIVDDTPSGGDTAATNTWALGRLKPGATRTFTWKVTAVRPGDYTLGYTVSPGLTGKARVEGTDNKGSFRVQISDEPPDARVDDAGNVVRGSAGAN